VGSLPRAWRRVGVPVGLRPEDKLDAPLPVESCRHFEINPFERHSRFVIARGCVVKLPIFEPVVGDGRDGIIFEHQQRQTGREPGRLRCCRLDLQLYQNYLKRLIAQIFNRVFCSSRTSLGAASSHLPDSRCGSPADPAADWRPAHPPPRIQPLPRWFRRPPTPRRIPRSPQLRLSLSGRHQNNGQSNTSSASAPTYAVRICAKDWLLAPDDRPTQKLDTPPAMGL